QDEVAKKQGLQEVVITIIKTIMTTLKQRVIINQCPLNFIITWIKSLSTISAIANLMVFI
ncbi:hypothetical protein, partial [Neisseria polysaccharea]